MIKRLLSAFSVFLLIAFLFAPSATAQFPYVIDQFDAGYKIEPQAEPLMTVTERVVVDFDHRRHGIFRYVPAIYREEGMFGPETNLRLKVLSVTDGAGKSRPYTEYSENRNIVVKIGDPDLFVSGRQVYIVKYQVENFVRFFEHQNEIVWDVNGTGWDTSIRKVRAVMIFPEDFVKENNIFKVKCATGVFGATEKECKVSNHKSSVTSETTGTLLPGENLTIAVAFHGDYFNEPSFADQYQGVIIRNIGIILPLLAIPVLVIYYRKRGKDPEGKGSIVTRFDAPKGLSPAHVGTLVDFKAESVELSATIIDLAVRGYIIIHDESKTDRAKKRKYTFELKNPNQAGLKVHEKEMIDGLFEKHEKAGETIKLDSLKNKFYLTANKIKEELYKSLVDEGYFVKDPKKSKVGMMGVGGVFLVGAVAALIITGGLGIGSFVGLGLTGIVALIIGNKMPARTLKGVHINEHILGLKQYLEVAEADRMKMMQGPDSRYIGDTAAPKFTVELYEKLLPYAVALGVEKQWSKKFEDIYTEPPDWYQGNWTTFSTIYMADRISNGMNNVGSVMTSTPSSSSGSSFSGGGFSGGGFGGGGGGSW